jgi:REP element-mobilizing transposase RayT
MPNHIHGIIKINTHLVGEDNILPYKHRWLSTIIKWFKQTTSKKLHKIWLDWFQRQRSFHDHIIINDGEFEKIVEYIKLNPYKWGNDEYHC